MFDMNVQESPTVSIHSAAETLLIFLESLREPIIPFNLFQRFKKDTPKILRQIFTQISLFRPVIVV